jgi:hypothetical protein
MFNVGIIFRIKLVLSIFGMDQQPDFILSLPASSLTFQTASDSRLPGVQFCIYGAANSIRINYAMQCSAPPLVSFAVRPISLVFFLLGRCNALGSLCGK